MNDIDKVLVIDDSIIICSTVEQILQQYQIETVMVHTGNEALECAVREMPELILLDIVLPDMNGFEVCKRLKEHDATSEIPIIFITSMSDEDSIAKSFTMGGADYVPKPFSDVELLARVHFHIQNKRTTNLLKKANDELELTNRKLELTNQQLAEALEEKRQWAYKDQLTNLYNRHYFSEMLSQWSKQSLMTNFSILMLDLDDFKKINDTYGHFAGDYILYTASEILLTCLKSEHIAVRWGGEEFLIVLPDSDQHTARALAESIRFSIESYPFCYDGIPLSCTTTIGVTQINPDISIEKNLINADMALYEGKNSNKNCIVVK
ncbi:MAG: diguanylate cyclase [Lachnospiraceae bacterium]